MSEATTACPTCQRHKADKPTWGAGSWQDEPERMEWEHAGLPCIAHRGGGGAWCGYVGVPPDHPAHGKEADEVDVAVHFGLTYAAPCHGCVCHVPKPGQPDNVWWLGWDCSHCDDFRPGDQPLYSRMNLRQTGEHYWTLAEVQEETNQLADQLVAMTLEAVKH